MTKEYVLERLGNESKDDKQFFSEDELWELIDCEADGVDFVDEVEGENKDDKINKSETKSK